MANGEQDKLYQLKCDHCGWRKFADGSEESFKGLYEYQGCQNCGGGRIFRCQGCGFQVRAKRVLEQPQQPKLERPKPIGYIRGVTEQPPRGDLRGR